MGKWKGKMIVIVEGFVVSTAAVSPALLRARRRERRA
jgi:hypothetical protein